MLRSSFLGGHPSKKQRRLLRLHDINGQVPESSVSNCLGGSLRIFGCRSPNTSDASVPTSSRHEQAAREVKSALVAGKVDPPGQAGSPVCLGDQMNLKRVYGSYTLMEL